MSGTAFGIRKSTRSARSGERGSCGSRLATAHQDWWILLNTLATRVAQRQNMDCINIVTCPGFGTDDAHATTRWEMLTHQRRGHGGHISLAPASKRTQKGSYYAGHCGGRIMRIYNAIWWEITPHKPKTVTCEEWMRGGDISPAHLSYTCAVNAPPIYQLPAAAVSNRSAGLFDGDVNGRRRSRGYMLRWRDNRDTNGATTVERPMPPDVLQCCNKNTIVTAPERKRARNGNAKWIRCMHTYVNVNARTFIVHSSWDCHSYPPTGLIRSGYRAECLCVSTFVYIFLSELCLSLAI